jgi:hypothetical protein
MCSLAQLFMWKLFFNIYEYLNLYKKKLFEKSEGKSGNKKSLHQRGYSLYISV